MLKQASRHSSSIFDANHRKSKQRFLKQTQLKIEDNKIYEYDLNQLNCFICLKSGVLLNCQNCYRSYHQTCHDLNSLMCFCSQNMRKCQFCFNSVSIQSEKIICSCCLQPSHIKCYSKKKNIDKLPTFINPYFSTQNRTYACLKCLQRHGFRCIKMVQPIKAIIDNRYKVNQLIGLVALNSKSPIHIGWFEQFEINKSKNKCLQNSVINKSIIDFCKFKQFTIDKILKIRPPIKFKKSNLDQISEVLSERQSSGKINYGSNENFTFLVKWADRDYTQLSWQDESVVMKNQLFTKFMMFKKYEIFFLREQRISTVSIFQTLSKYYPKPQFTFNEVTTTDIMFSYRQKYELQLIKIEKSILDEPTFRLISCYLNKIYLNTTEQNPSLIIVSQDKIIQCEQTLKIKNSILNLLCFNGSEQNINIIKQVDFKFQNIDYVKFQICVTTPKIYSLHIKHFQRFIKKFSTVIFYDLNDFKFLSQYKSQKNYQNKIADRQIFFLSDQDPEFNSKILKIKSILRRNTDIIHDINGIQIESIKPRQKNRPLQIQQIQISESEEEEKINNSNKLMNFNQILLSKVNKDKQMRWSSAKRMKFIEFIWSFGFNFKNINQFYGKLSETFSKLFPISSQHQQLPKTMNYIQKFLACCKKFIEQSLDERDKKQYFMDMDPRKIIRRISEIQKLQMLLELLTTNNMQDLQAPKIVNEKLQSVQLVSWKIQDDIILLNLIMKYGADKWKDILESKCWSDYRSIKSTPTQISYQSHLRLKIKIQMKMTIRNGQEILKNRLEQLINLCN